jgi:hypothetical protein
MKAWTAFLAILTALGMRFGFKVDENLYWSIEGFFALLLGAQALNDHGKAAALIGANTAIVAMSKPIDASLADRELMMANLTVGNTNDDPDMGGEAKKIIVPPNGFITIGFALAIAAIGILILASSCNTLNAVKTDADNLKKKVYACAGEEKATIEKDFNAFAFVIDVVTTVGGTIISGGDVNNVIDVLITKYGPVFKEHTEAVVACTIKDYRSTILGLPENLKPQPTVKSFAGIAPRPEDVLDGVIKNRNWQFSN